MTNKRLIKWMLGTALVIAVAVVFYWSRERPVLEVASPPVAQPVTELNASSPDTVIDVKSTRSVLNQWDTSSFAQCQQIIHNLRVEQENWRKSTIERWSDFLQQGYSLDEVTLAVAHFQNSNFAATFRINQLRKNATLTQTNNMLQDTLYERAPKLADKGLTISRAVPQPALNKIPELTAAEKQNVINGIEVTVDDVAAVTQLPAFSDNDIIQLINAVDDVSATVGYEHIDDATSLLDFAAASGRLRVFNHLIDAGLSPTHDAYLGSTMEWALSGLMRCCERRQQRAEIVKRLMQLGARARFSEQSPERVYGSFPRFFYEFDRADIETLRQNYGLNVVSIKPRKALQTAQNNALINKLSKQRDQFIAKHYDVTDVAGIREACQATLTAVTEQWQPRQHQDVIKAFQDGSNELSTAVAAQLAQIDPALVDSYRRHFRPYEQKVLYTSLINRVSHLLADGDIEQALVELERASLDAPHQRFLIAQILAYDLAFYQSLMGSTLMDAGLQLQQLESLGLTVDTVKTLAEAGYDIGQYDDDGKTLVYYATQAGNRQLVKWLLQRGIPYSGDALGADPLYVALKRMGRGGNSDIILITELMRVDPQITNFHRQRAAVIKLRYPKRYKHLIAKFPALTVTEHTALPEVW